MPFGRTTALALILSLAPFINATGAPADQSPVTQDIDRSIEPGDDFYRYANGTWLRTAAIPAGQRSFDTRAILVERTSQRVRELIQEAAASQASKGNITQKVGAYYASYMDVDTIDSKGLTPLADEMARISAIENKASLSTYLGATLNTEVDGLTSNADHVFGVWVNQGFADSEHYVFHLMQGGLGMPDRDDYIDPSPKMARASRSVQTSHRGDAEIGWHREFGGCSRRCIGSGNAHG